jgi:predicted RNase H-like HicB family nuclease
LLYALYAPNAHPIKRMLLMPTIEQLIVRIDAQLPWRFTIGKGGNYVAVCDPLQLTLQAETWADLMEDTSDVLNSVFKDLLKNGQLDAFLRMHGWNFMGQVPQRDQENVRFDVPFFFIPEMAQPHGPANYLR